MEAAPPASPAPPAPSSSAPSSASSRPSKTSHRNKSTANVQQRNVKPPFRQGATVRGGRQGRGSRSQPKLNPSAEPWEPSSEKKIDDECLLCASHLGFVAIGWCNHPICSVCSMRLRLRSQDKSCAICKTTLNTIVVCPFRHLKPFAAFDVDDDSPTIGVDVELRSRSFFVDCKEHFKEINQLISLKCPSCDGKFQSEKALFKHVKVAHSKQFCELCFTHRPLFSCEQKLMTSSELTEHLNSPPGALIGSGGDKSGGHPLCKFCSQRFFDSQALYVHMRDAHFTCHLCPSRYQQRFYRGVHQLYNHLQNSHFICHVCLPSSTELSAFHNYGTMLHSSFARKEEYSEHMRSSHGILTSSSGNSNSLSLALAASFGSRSAPSSEDQTSFEYIDLNMASADPYRLDSNPTQNINLESFETETIIPPHMRVLGRVTGGGTFLSEEALAEEEARLEELRHGGRNQKQRKDKSNQKQRHSPPSALSTSQPAQFQDFPALVSASNPQEATGQKHHPLSVVPSLIEKEKLQKAKAAEEEHLRLQEREIAVRKVQRNMALADALGLDTMAIADAVKMIPSFGATDSRSDYELDSGLIQYLMTNSFLSNLKLCVEYVTPTACVKSSARVDLRRPIYHPDMLVWAKTFRADLLRTEKKIYELLTDRTLSSVQLKPMKKWSRDSVMLLAKYYHLGAQEYSTLQKDDMYVSLVKNIDSCLPATPLSAAADPPTGTGLSSTELQSLLVEELRLCVEKMEFRPQILFTVRRAGAGANIGEFLCEVKFVFDSDSSKDCQKDDYITDLSCLGYSHIRLTFSTLSAALFCHRLFQKSNVPNKYHIDPYFMDDGLIGIGPVVEKDFQIAAETEWRSQPPSTLPVAPPAPDKWDLAFQAARNRPRPILQLPQSRPVVENLEPKKAPKKPKNVSTNVASRSIPINSFSLLDNDSDDDALA